MKRHLRNLQRVAADRQCELWFDVHLRKWALMELSTFSCCGHYFTSAQVQAMSEDEMRKACAHLHTLCSRFGMYQQPACWPAVRP